jgi:hypothetical protein
VLCGVFDIPELLVELLNQRFYLQLSLVHLNQQLLGVLLSPYSPVQGFHLDMGISSDINWYRQISAGIQRNLTFVSHMKFLSTHKQ